MKGENIPTDLDKENIREIKFADLSQEAQTFLQTQRANKRSGPGPFNNWTVIGTEAIDILRENNFGD